jgi:predicted neutral ceramidase superfamily lipid hydrolase
MNFTFGSFGLRFLFSAILLFATYNPEGYSYFHWVKDTFPSISIEQAFVGVVLVIGYVIYLRATLRSLGMIGLILAFLFFGLMVGMMFKWGWLTLDSSKLLAYVVEILLAVVLAVGMSWSHIRRRMSGRG